MSSFRFLLLLVSFFSLFLSSPHPMWSILQLTDFGTDSHTQTWETNVWAQTCTFLPSVFLFCWFFDEKDKVLFQFRSAVLVLSIYQSPSIPLQRICCDGGWCKACTSLFRIFFFFFFFFALSYLLFLKSFSYTDRCTTFGVERIPINLEVVCLVLLIRSILCRGETRKIVTQLKRNLSELQ